MTKQADRIRKSAHSAVQRVHIYPWLPRAQRDATRNRLCDLFEEHLSNIASARRVSQSDVADLAANIIPLDDDEVAVYTNCEELPCFIVRPDGTICDQECPDCGQLAPASALQQSCARRRRHRPTVA